MRVSAFFVSNGFLTIMSKYSIAYFFKIVKWLAAFLPDLRGRGILPPIDETIMKKFTEKGMPPEIREQLDKYLKKDYQM